jgi:hypothetical protein
VKQSHIPSHSVDDEYIREWLMLGPFFPDDLEGDSLVHIGGEASIEPGEGDSVTTADGRTLVWKRHESKGNVVDLYDLCATLGTEGDLREEICLCERTHQTINLTLKPAIIIEGTLLMLDDKTPHVAVIVQAVLPLNLTPPAPFLRKYR